MHGNFKVTDTVFAEGCARDYTREQWEAALQKAKQRTKAEEWPVIKSSDFLFSSLRTNSVNLVTLAAIRRA